MDITYLRKSEERVSGANYKFNIEGDEKEHELVTFYISMNDYVGHDVEADKFSQSINQEGFKMWHGNTLVRCFII
jgi:hypothetical protein